MFVSLILFFLCTMAFIVFHSLLASGKVKRSLYRNLIGYRHYRIFYNLVSVLSLSAIVLMYLYADKKTLWHPGLLSFLIGTVLIILAIVAWRRAFNNYSLSEFMGTDRLKSNEAVRENLNTGGLHQFVRHPVYSFTYPLLVGMFLLFPNDHMLILILSFSLYIPVGIRFEEQKLIKTFGQDYRIYKKQVPVLCPRFGDLGDLIRVLFR